MCLTIQRLPAGETTGRVPVLLLQAPMWRAAHLAITLAAAAASQSERPSTLAHRSQLITSPRLEQDTLVSHHKVVNLGW